MNSQKQDQLFRAARGRQPIQPPAEFAADVLRVIRSQRLVSVGGSWLDQLTVLFPRVAAAALVVIIAAAVFEIWNDADITTQICDASEQLLLPLDWL